MIPQNPTFVPVESTGTSISYCLSMVAKMLQLSPKNFIELLASHRYIFKRTPHSSWEAYQSFINANVLTHRTIRIEHNSGDISYQLQVRVTAKGISHFLNHLA